MSAPIEAALPPGGAAAHPSSSSASVQSSRPGRKGSLAALSGMLLLGLLTLLMIGALNTGAEGLAVGIVLATAPVPFYLLLARHVDRYEKEPFWLLAGAFLWGATVAVFLSFVLNSLAAAVFFVAAGESAGELGGTLLAAPVVEELAKGAVLLLLFHRMRDEFDNVTDGIVYATMVGLGFAMTENVSYYGIAWSAGVEGSLHNFLSRGVLGPFAHPLFTAATGIGLGLARELQRPDLRRVLPALGLAVAISLHFAWNLLAAFEEYFLVGYAVVMVPTFAGAIGVVAHSHARERRLIRTHLAPHAEEGLLGPEEMEAICRAGGRRRARFRALRSGGVRGWRRERALQDAATRLAFHRWRASRGLTPGVDADLAREADLIARIREIRRSPAQAAALDAPHARVCSLQSSARSLPLER